MEALKLVALVTIGCGRIGFDATSHGVVNADAGADVAPPACRGRGPFSTPARVAAVNTPITQYGSSISPDGLTLYYDEQDATAMNHQRIRVSTRASLADTFGPSTLVTDLASVDDDFDASTTADGLELYFESNRSSVCVFRATRTSTSQPFGNPVKLGATCATVGSAGPAISADGLVLAYSSILDGANEGDLWISERASRSDEFGQGTRLANLPALVGYPHLSSDKLRLWFEHENNGVEIRYAERASPADDFSPSVLLPELELSTLVGDPGLTLDETTIVFSSNISDGNLYDVYIATRPCE